VKLYLASRYTRRAEMLEYAEELEALGHEVVSRWILGEHDSEEATPTDAQQASWAGEDFGDIYLSDALIAFTETPDIGYSRGGRMVELGIALGLHRLVYLVGPAENCFCHLPQVQRYSSWKACRRALGPA
jgi:hypothetical protein